MTKKKQVEITFKIKPITYEIDLEKLNNKLYSKKKKQKKK